MAKQGSSSNSQIDEAYLKKRSNHMEVAYSEREALNSLIESGDTEEYLILSKWLVNLYIN